jgi:hypothetical protein
MGVPEPPAEPPRRKPLVRLWLVAVLLFAAGFVGKRVLEAQPGTADGYIVTILWQMGWYAAGLVAWFWWACTQSAADKLGCGVGLGLMVAATFDVMSSCPK